MRKPWIDALRSGAVLLVVLYHVCYIYNGVGVLGGFSGARSLTAGNVLLYAVYPWFMVLLFAVAGVCAHYSLETRTPHSFLRSRSRTLLVPSTIGVAVFQWTAGLLNLHIAKSLSQMPALMVYPIAVLCGVGPLWFSQMLFLYCCLLAFALRIAPKQTEKLWSLCGRLKGAALLALFVPLWCAAQVLNAPVIVVYRFGIYGMAFLLGYFVLSHEETQKLLEALHLPLLVAAVCGGIAYTVHYYGQDYTSQACLQSMWTNLYAWCAVLALFGCTQHWCKTQFWPVYAALFAASGRWVHIHRALCHTRRRKLRFDACRRPLRRVDFGTLHTQGSIFELGGVGRKSALTLRRLYAILYLTFSLIVNRLCKAR